MVWGRSHHLVPAPPGTWGLSSCCDKGRKSWSIISHPDSFMLWLHQFCLQPIVQNKPYGANQNGGWGGRDANGYLVCAKCLGHGISFLFAQTLSDTPNIHVFFLSSLCPFPPLLVSGHGYVVGSPSIILRGMAIRVLWVPHDKKWVIDPVSNVLVWLSPLKDTLAGYGIPGWHLSPFRRCNSNIFWLLLSSLSSSALLLLFLQR